MHMYIPSRGREGNVLTVENLPASLRYLCSLVVHESEYDDYHREYGECVDVLPVSVEGIGPVRQYCVERARRHDGKRVLMLDDDLRFATRRDDEPTKFRDSTDNEIVRGLQQLWDLLNQYSHVGMATREGGNRNVARMEYNTRLLRVLGYRVDWMEIEDIRFDQIPVMEDFYVSLKFLSNGYANAKLNWMVQDQAGSQKAGGCSEYRTMEVQAEAAHRLKAHFPDFVTVVEKTTKTAWGGGTRTDVRIQWKKAYDSIS